MNQPTPQQVLEALLDGNDDLFIVDNIISTTNAIIYMSQSSKRDAEAQYALFELEKRFRFYVRLWQMIS